MSRATHPWGRVAGGWEMEVHLRRARMWLSSGNLHKTSPNSPVTFLALPFWKEGRIFAELFCFLI